MLNVKFQKSKSFNEKLQDFSQISHKQSQNVTNLASEIDLAANAYLNIDENSDANLLDLGDKIKLNKFIDILRSDIRIEVKKQNPQTFNAAKNIAINIENALKDPEFNANPISISDVNTLINSQIQTNEKIEQLNLQLSKLSCEKTVNHVNLDTPTNSQPNQSNEFVDRCLICGKSHLTINCWHFPAVKKFSNNFGNKNNFNRVNKNFRRPFRGGKRGRQNPNSFQSLN